MLVAHISADVGHARMDHLDKRAMKRIAKDWKIYIGTVAYMGILNNGYAGSVSHPIFPGVVHGDHNGQEMT